MMGADAGHLLGPREATPVHYGSRVIAQDVEGQAEVTTSTESLKASRSRSALAVFAVAGLVVMAVMGTLVGSARRPAEVAPLGQSSERAINLRIHTACVPEEVKIRMEDRYNFEKDTAKAFIVHHDINNPSLFKMDQALQMTRVSTDETNGERGVFDLTINRDDMINFEWGVAIFDGTKLLYEIGADATDEACMAAATSLEAKHECAKLSPLASAPCTLQTGSFSTAPCPRGEIASRTAPSLCLAHA